MSIQCIINLACTLYIHGRTLYNVNACRDQNRYVADAESRARAMSTTGGPAHSSVVEPTKPDYLEIASIPPLPLYALLAADDNPGFSECHVGVLRVLQHKRSYW